MRDPAVRHTGPQHGGAAAGGQARAGAGAGDHVRAGAAPAGTGTDALRAAFRADVVHGLAPGVRKLPPKHFYDDAGAALFERITTLDEYYPTRTEIGILRRHLPEIAARIGAGARIVEFGSGSGIKTRLLLQALPQPAAYVPVDISAAQLADFAAEVRDEFPGLAVQPVSADYLQPLSLPPAAGAARTVAFFPGSTIGNLEPLEAAAFLRRLARHLGPGAGLLLGTDMHKPAPILERAYNDDAGVTAAFNLNMLARMQRELGATLDLAAWRHVAFYDEVKQRVEMRVEATAPTSIALPPPEPARFDFAAGEWITTEYSHKYTLDGVRDLAERTGWSVDHCWQDDGGWFTVWLLTSNSRR